MVQSLWFKLIGAFALVILVVVGLVMLVTLRATTSQFELYVNRQGQAWAQRIGLTLADYYAATGSWQGVQDVMQAPVPGMMAGGQGRGMAGWHGMGGMMSDVMSEMMASGDMWAMMGYRLVLANATGTVVGDTADSLLGTHLKDADLIGGVPIAANGQMVGTLLVAAHDVPASPARGFLRSVNVSVLLGGLVAGLVALLLGSLLFFQITTPMRRLARAAQGIAAGDLSQRVPVALNDEVGQLARSFNGMAESLQQMEWQRQNMMADIAHELRTPLAVIQSNVEAMLDGVLPANREELESIHQETLLLNRLIGDLRTLSLAEAGQLALDKQSLDLGVVVARAAEKFHLRAQAQNTTLRVEPAAGLPPVLADAGRIEQVLSNLLDNALRYAAGGRVTLGAQAVPGGVQVWVSDSGPGFSPNELPHVFERFWRAERSDERQAAGSGIGLALVKQLAEAHGGQVNVQSAPGQGATFRITLPAHS